MSIISLRVCLFGRQTICVRRHCLGFLGYWGGTKINIIFFSAFLLIGKPRRYGLVSTATSGELYIDHLCHTKNLEKKYPSMKLRISKTICVRATKGNPRPHLRVFVYIYDLQTRNGKETQTISESPPNKPLSHDDHINWLLVRRYLCLSNWLEEIRIARTWE